MLLLFIALCANISNFISGTCDKAAHFMSTNKLKGVNEVNNKVVNE